MRLKFLLFLFLFSTGLSAQKFYMGLDMSYTNEMEDCDVVYYQNNAATDPFALFAGQGANLARFRLWHTPDWTNYSTLQDVKTSIGRAKENGMTVLLDFHYSDTWADPGNQLRPAAWNDIDDITLLGDSLYNYTLHTLEVLNSEGLLPEMVQIGNETNVNILLKPGETSFPIDWNRNVNLFGRALAAVANFNATSGNSVKTIIHIANPETALWWFQDAKTHGLTAFDIIGISYYPGWSDMGIRQAATAIGELITAHQKEVMIVETAYPWTLAWNDNASNNMGENNLLKTYGTDTSPFTQYEFLSELTWLVQQQGCTGLMFWEPGWVSSECYTPWGQGSHWENVALFDFDNKLHEGAAYLNYNYTGMPAGLEPVQATFKVDMKGVDVTNGVFVTGVFTGQNWQLIPMNPVGNNIYEYTTQIPGRSQGAYIFRNNNDWDDQWREPVPAECALYWNSHREFVVGKEDIEFGFVWGSCNKIDGTGLPNHATQKFKILPNPATNLIEISSQNLFVQVDIFNVGGEISKTFSTSGLYEAEINISGLKAGMYLVKIMYDNQAFDNQLIIKK